jgi:hypothetical protein
MDNLKNNWNKLNSYFTDVIGALDGLYAESTDRDQKINAIRKRLLWSRIRNSCQKSINQTLEAISRGSKDITDERMLNIINQDWSELFKLEHLKDEPIAANVPDVQAAVQKVVQDGLSPNAQSAYNELLCNGAENIGIKLDRKDQAYANIAGISNTIKQKCHSDLENLEDVVFSPELVAKYGSDTLVSFVEVIGFYPEVAALGSLLSRKNRGAFQDKINYLSNLVRRGVDIGKSEQEIEMMTPEEVTNVFDQIRDMLETMYHSPGEIARRMSDEGSFFRDQDIAKWAADAGFPQITSKRDLSALKGKQRAPILSAILDAFDKSEYKKYYVDQIRSLEAMRAYMEKYISNAGGNAEFLQRHGFQNRDEFMRNIGVHGGHIGEFLKNSPDRRMFQIANKYFPKLMAAYNHGLLSKTKADKAKGVDIEAIVDEALAEHEMVPQDTPLNKGKRPYGPGSPRGTQDALFFAKILDMEAPQRVAARIKAIKRLASAMSVRQKFVKMNVDTSVIDAIIRGIKDGGRQGMGFKQASRR